MTLAAAYLGSGVAVELKRTENGAGGRLVEGSLLSQYTCISPANSFFVSLLDQGKKVLVGEVAELRR